MVVLVIVGKSELQLLLLVETGELLPDGHGQFIHIFLEISGAGSAPSCCFISQEIRCLISYNPFMSEEPYQVNVNILGYTVPCLSYYKEEILPSFFLVEIVQFVQNTLAICEDV